MNVSIESPYAFITNISSMNGRLMVHGLKFPYYPPFLQIAGIQNAITNICSIRGKKAWKGILRLDDDFFINPNLNVYKSIKGISFKKCWCNKNHKNWHEILYEVPTKPGDLGQNGFILPHSDHYNQIWNQIVGVWCCSVSSWTGDKVNRNIVGAVGPVARTKPKLPSGEDGELQLRMTSETWDKARCKTQQAVEWKNLHPNSIGPTSNKLVWHSRNQAAP